MAHNIHPYYDEYPNILYNFIDESPPEVPLQERYDEYPDILNNFIDESPPEVPLQERL